MFRISDLDLKLLNVFIAVVESGGFSGAQARLGRSTSTISTYMSDIETRLGYKLCHRGRTGFRLTDRGAKAYVTALALMRTIEDSSNELYSLRGTLTGVLKFGIVESSPLTAPSFHFVQVIKEFNEVENDIKLELSVEPTEVLESMVLSGRLHAAVGHFDSTSDSINSTPLYSEDNDVYVVSNYKELAAKAKQTQDYLKHFKLAVQRFQIDTELKKFQKADYDALISSVEAMLPLILSGDYVGYLPALYASTWEQKGLITRLDSKRFRWLSPHSFITRKTTIKFEALSLLKTLISKHCS